MRLFILIVVLFTRWLLSFNDKRPFRITHFPSRVATVPPQGKVPPGKIMHPQVKQLESQRALGYTISFRRSKLMISVFLEEVRWEEELGRRLDAEVHVAVWSEVVVTNGEAIHGWEELAEEFWCGWADGIVVDGREVVDRKSGGNSCIAGKEFDRMVTLHILRCIIILIVLVVVRLFTI